MLARTQILARQVLGQLRGHGSSSLIAIGVTVMLVLGTAGFVIGRGEAALRFQVRPGAAWLPTSSHGAVSLVDGQSGQASVELLLKGARGHYLVVSQVGTEVLVLDTSTGMLVRVNAAELALGAETQTTQGSAVVAGLAATYVVDYQAGTVQRIDPVTLAPIGQAVTVPGQLGHSAVVDSAGTLWLPVVSAGTVVLVTSTGIGKPVQVGASGASLVLATAGGVPIAVDRTARRVTMLGGGAAQKVITLPASAAAGGSQALLVPASADAGSLPMLNQNSPSLVIVNLTTGTTHDVPLGAEVTGHTLGQPVQAGERIFVPDFSTGSVLVYDTAGSATTTVPVTGHPGPFQSTVVDGIAYFNDANGSDAVVVTPDGQVHQVTKTGPDVPTTHNSPPSGFGPGPDAPSPTPTRTPSRAPSSPGPSTSGPPSTTPSTTPSTSQAPSPNPTGGLPLAPVNPQAAAGPGYVDVSWQPPASGGTVSSYQVAISPAASASQAKTSATSVRVTGLSCATQYTFTVYSVGASGQQVPAPPVTARPCVAPGTPQGLSSSVSPGQIQLSWSGPASSGGGVVSYNVSWNGGGRNGVTGTSYTINGLANFQTYGVTVTAVSPAGNGGAATASVSLAPGTTWGYHIYNNSVWAVNVRAAPTTSSASQGSFGANSFAAVQVVCQVSGGYYKDPSSSGVPAGTVWDKIIYGGGYGYVADGYVSTPNSMNNSFSPPIWPC